MDSRPFFSIAIPTYNRSKKIKTAIERLLVQDFEDFEIVVSDNCSTDDTKDVVNSFNSSKIKYFKNKQNIDVLPNVKKSIELSRGEYIFLHGDDDFLIEKNTLSEIYKLIKKTNAGYIRLNYLSISPDNKHIFDFRASKHYTENVQLKPNQENIKVIDFLLKSDPSFISGIIFKNALPDSVSTINSELYSWFPIIFYSAKKYGGYYVDKPYIFALWSQWRVRADTLHPFFSLSKEKLTSEKYFEFVKSKISKSEYKKFQIEHLFGVYVKNFMAIKLFTGNKNMIRLSARLLYLEHNLKHKMSFWLNLLLAIVFPRIVLSLLRKYYLSVYIRRHNLDSKYNVKTIIEND